MTVIRKTHCNLLDDDQNEILGDNWTETENNPIYGTSMTGFRFSRVHKSLFNTVSISYGYNLEPNLSGWIGRLYLI